MFILLLSLSSYIATSDATQPEVYKRKEKNQELSLTGNKNWYYSRGPALIPVTRYYNPDPDT
jgi:hypothetical protein